MIAPHPADTSPKDGRLIRGWFRFDGGAQLIAVSGDPERSTWVNLLGEPIGRDSRIVIVGINRRGSKDSQLR